MKVPARHGLKPRNPYALLAGRRHGGSHAKGPGVRRQEQQRALRRSLREQE